MLLLLQSGEYAVAQFTTDAAVLGYALRLHHFAQVSQKVVGLRNVLQTVLVAVEVVVYDCGIRLLALGDVRQQTRTTEQIHEYRVLRILLQNLDELTREHALLSHERERCR